MQKYAIVILSFVDRASLFKLVNTAKLVYNFSQYVYFFSLHVSGDCVSIIRRNNCIYATPGTCHYMWMTVWYAPCISDSHPYGITSTRCRIDTSVSPDDGQTVARNM